MKNNYLQEMAESGYNAANISAFHKICLPYLGRRFFSDKQSRIMDIGAGQGHCLLPLKENGYENLYAADIDSHNKVFFENSGIKFLHVDAEQETFPIVDDFLDAVLLFHVIEHLKDPSCLLSEVHRMLKNDGVFILVTPDWRKQHRIFYRDHTHVHPYDKISIERLLKCSGFHPVSIKSFGVFRSLGKTGIWKWIKPLMFSGIDIIAVSKAL